MAGFVHGTPSAYRKCIQRHEGACEACKAAEAAYKASLRARKAAEAAESLADAMEALPEAEGPLDELGEQRTMLRMLDALLYRAKSPRDSAPLINQRREVVARIAELQRDAEIAARRVSGEAVNARDEIAQRRAARLDRATG